MELAHAQVADYEFMGGVSPHSLGNQLKASWDTAVPIKYDFGVSAVDVARALISMSKITMGRVPHIDKMAVDARKLLEIESPEELARMDTIFDEKNKDSEEPMG